MKLQHLQLHGRPQYDGTISKYKPYDATTVPTTNQMNWANNCAVVVNIYLTCLNYVIL